MVNMIPKPSLTKVNHQQITVCTRPAIHLFLFLISACLVCSHRHQYVGLKTAKWKINKYNLRKRVLNILVDGACIEWTSETGPCMKIWIMDFYSKLHRKTGIHQVHNQLWNIKKCIWSALARKCHCHTLIIMIKALQNENIKMSPAFL